MEENQYNLFPSNGIAIIMPQGFPIFRHQSFLYSILKIIVSIGPSFKFIHTFSKERYNLSASANQMPGLQVRINFPIPCVTCSLHLSTLQGWRLWVPGTVNWLAYPTPCSMRWARWCCQEWLISCGTGV